VTIKSFFKPKGTSQNGGDGKAAENSQPQKHQQLFSPQVKKSAASASTANKFTGVNVKAEPVDDCMVLESSPPSSSSKKTPSVKTSETSSLQKSASARMLFSFLSKAPSKPPSDSAKKSEESASKGAQDCAPGTSSTDVTELSGEEKALKSADMGTAVHGEENSAALTDNEKNGDSAHAERNNSNGEKATPLKSTPKTKPHKGKGQKQKKGGSLSCDLDDNDSLSVSETPPQAKRRRGKQELNCAKTETEKETLCSKANDDHQDDDSESVTSRKQSARISKRGKASTKSLENGELSDGGSESDYLPSDSEASPVKKKSGRPPKSASAKKSQASKSRKAKQSAKPAEKSDSKETAKPADETSGKHCPVCNKQFDLTVWNDEINAHIDNCLIE
jgi:hypothetical protein